MQVTEGKEIVYGERHWLIDFLDDPKAVEKLISTKKSDATGATTAIVEMQVVGMKTDVAGTSAALPVDKLVHDIDADNAGASVALPVGKPVAFVKTDIPGTSAVFLVDQNINADESVTKTKAKKGTLFLSNLFPYHHF